MSKRSDNTTIAHDGWVFDTSCPVIDDEYGPGWLGWMINCPRCGGGNLHPAHVTAFPMANGDGRSVSLHDGRDIKPPNRDNPSEYRQAAIVGFFCEACDVEHGKQASIELTIALGDGNTFLAWRDRPEDAPRGFV